MRKSLKVLTVIMLSLAMVIPAGIAFNAMTQTVSAASGTWKEDGNGWWYQNHDGSYPSGTWQLIGGQWYHFKASGYMSTGWVNDGGKWYYLAASGAMQAEKWVGDYYLGESGAMATNQWITMGYSGDNNEYNNERYYVGNDGKWIPDEWVKDTKGWWYRFGDGSYPHSSPMGMGIHEDYTIYYFKANGYMASDEWIQFGAEDDLTWNYFNPDGSLALSQWVGNYFVGAYASIATNTWVGPYFVEADGLWRGRMCEHEWAVIQQHRPNSGSSGGGDSHYYIAYDDERFGPDYSLRAHEYGCTKCTAISIVW